MAEQQRQNAVRLPWTRPRDARAAPRAGRLAHAPSARGCSSCAALLRRCGPSASRRGSSTCRSSQHADLIARAPNASRCARSPRRPSAARSSIATGACSPTASTPTSIVADPVRDRRSGRRRGRGVRARSTTATPPTARRWRRSCAAAASSPTSQRQVSPDEAQRVRALELQGHRRSSRRAAATTRTGARRARARLRRPRQRRARRPRVGVRRADPRPATASSWSRPTPRQQRCSAASSARRPPARARADDRSVPAVRRRARAARRRRGEPRRGRHRVIMDPHTGEILALANYPTFNPNTFGARPTRRAAQPRGPGPLRAGLDVQDRHRVGGARRARDHARTI